MILRRQSFQFENGRGDAGPGDDRERRDEDGMNEKVDLDGTLEAVSALADALKARRRLPPTLTAAQRDELRTFIDESLADADLGDSSAEVWHAVDPDVATSPRSPLASDVVAVVLEKADRSVDALAFFDRLRG